MNYSDYRFTGKEIFQNASIGFLISSIIVYLFYQSYLAIILLGIPFNYFYIKKKEKDYIKKRKLVLNLDFKECVLSLSTALSAGYSIENAFEEARKDMALLYPDESDIMIELRNIEKQIHMNQNVEKLLTDFAVRSGVEDILSFAEVFTTAKRTGGDLIKIMDRTADNLNQKIEMKREIETMIAAKKLESKIMSIVPLAMILYLWLFSPGYLTPLYHNVFGVMFMTGAMLLYIAAYLLMEKIMNITV